MILVTYAMRFLSLAMCSSVGCHILVVCSRIGCLILDFCSSTRCLILFMCSGIRCSLLAACSRIERRVMHNGIDGNNCCCVEITPDGRNSTKEYGKCLN